LIFGKLLIISVAFMLSHMYNSTWIFHGLGVQIFVRPFQLQGRRIDET